MLAVVGSVLVRIEQFFEHLACPDSMLQNAFFVFNLILDILRLAVFFSNPMNTVRLQHTSDSKVHNRRETSDERDSLLCECNAILQSSCIQKRHPCRDWRSDNGTALLKGVLELGLSWL